MSISVDVLDLFPGAVVLVVSPSLNPGGVKHIRLTTSVVTTSEIARSGETATGTSTGEYSEISAWFWYEGTVAGGESTRGRKRYGVLTSGRHSPLVAVFPRNFCV